MTGVVGDLTTLANVKAWRDPPVASGADDPTLQLAITAGSNFILNSILQRTLITKTYSEVRNGQGTRAMRLRNYPIVAVTALTIGMTPVVAAANAEASGYVFDSATGMLYLRGYEFCRGVQNVAISYQAGLLVQNEPQAVSGSNQVSCGSLAQLWAADNGVVDNSGTALVAVTGSPSAGQYVPAAGPDGSYLFAAGVASPVKISYSFTPRDLERAAIIAVILEYNRRSRIGVNSKGLAGENITFFTQKATVPSVEAMLNPYRDVTPVEP